MADTFQVSIDMSQWEKSLQMLGERAVLAQIRALNRSASTARTAMTRVVSSSMRLKSATVREEIKITKASAGHMTASLNASMERIPLIKFGAKGPEPSRGVGRGVTANTNTRRYPRAFIATMRSGHRGVFQRKGIKRLPIFELKERSIGYVFDMNRDTGLNAGMDAIVKNLKHEFEFALRESTQK